MGLEEGEDGLGFELALMKVPGKMFWRKSMVKVRGKGIKELQVTIFLMALARLL